MTSSLPKTVGTPDSLLPSCLHPKLHARLAELTTEDSSEALPLTEGRAQEMKNEEYGMKKSEFRASA